MLRLIAKADVLVYNVRPQAMARLQLDYDVVAKVNPRLIYAGVFGFGQDGPYAAKPAYDDLIQGATALPALMAQTSDGVPRYVPNALEDLKALWSIFIPVSIVQFSLMPIHLRVPFTATAGFFWCGILSLMRGAERKSLRE